MYDEVLSMLAFENKAFQAKFLTFIISQNKNFISSKEGGGLRAEIKV